MRILLLLATLILAPCQSSAAKLDLSRITTAVDLSKFESDTIVVSTSERRLFYKMQDGQVVGYSVAVGQEGMNWTGKAVIKRITEWPDWIPPADMLKRKPYLPKLITGGEGNPLGEYALYLFQGDRDTLYRIHGTNDSASIGEAKSSGCIRMLNKNVRELAGMVRIGTKVVVLP